MSEENEGIELKKFEVIPKKYKTIEIALNVSNIKAFDTIYGVIIWCCYKTCHITDQYFDDLVNQFVQRLMGSSEYGNINTLTYFQFRDLIPTADFGENDDEFWLMVFRLLQEPELFTFILDGETHCLNDKTIRLFKPYNYL